MLQAVADWAGSTSFLPHGYCLAWDPLLLWTMVGSHAVIGVSYFSIPIALFLFVRQQKDLRFNFLFVMFGLFILACGTTHFIELLNIWYPVYRADAAVEALTAGISIATALMLWPLLPQVSAYLATQRQTRVELQEVNQRLAESLRQIELRRAEAEQTERRFRLTFESAPIGLAMVGLDGRWIDVNQVLCAMLGYSEAELLSRTFQDVTHPDDLEADLQQVRELLDGRGTTYRMEKRYFHKQGQVIHVQLDVALLRDEQGRPLHFISQIQDISQRQQAALELAHSQQQLEAGYLRLQRHNQEITALSELSAVLQACQNFDEMVAPMSSYGQRLFPGWSGALYLIHASRNYLECVVRFGSPELSEPVFGSNACWALRRGETQWLGEGGLRCTHVHADTGGRAILCVPVTAQGETIGIAYLQSNAPLNPAELDESRPHMGRLAAMVADRLGIAIANVKLRESLRLQSIRDPLTGLLNRRYLEESLPRELGLALREEQPLAVLMIDVDHFKRFNDTYGHDTGDQALRMVGGLFASQFRGSDIACRFGGEEFCIVLPGASRAEATARAVQLCGRVRELSVMHHGNVVGTLTISVGIALCPTHGESMEVLLEAADAALYQAKRAGRDRVICLERSDRSAA